MASNPGTPNTSPTTPTTYRTALHTPATQPALNTPSAQQTSHTPSLHPEKVGHTGSHSTAPSITIHRDATARTYLLGPKKLPGMAWGGVWALPKAANRISAETLSAAAPKGRAGRTDCRLAPLGQEAHLIYPWWPNSAWQKGCTRCVAPVTVMYP